MSVLKKIMREYDQAQDDASWDEDHPIFRMAENIDSLRLQVAALQLKSDWISVEDRLPEMGKRVAVWVKFDTPEGGFSGVDEWAEYQERPLSFSSETIITGEGWSEHDYEDITHWMPLPLPPQPDSSATQE